MEQDSKNISDLHVSLVLTTDKLGKITESFEVVDKKNIPFVWIIYPENKNDDGTEQ